VKIHEIYQSIQGESSYAGQACVFIRTTGCSLRCRWCDTAHAFYDGEELSLDTILKKVRDYGCDCVELTGGEPLIQEESFPLMTALLDEGYRVLLETSGSIPIHKVDPRAVIILDIKCPGSGMTDSMDWENLNGLKETDEVKFVIADQADFIWAKNVLETQQSLRNKIIHFSPVYGEMDPQQLAASILKERLPVRLQIQIHKYIWDASTKGV